MTTTLSEKDVPAQVKRLLEVRASEANRLDRIYQYLRNPDFATSSRTSVNGNNNGPLRWLKAGVPEDVKRLAELSRVNMLKFVVSTLVQNMYVDGFRAPKAEEEEPSWTTWQVNRMDARQIGVHRAALSYGASYVTVLPGSRAPVIRGVSPRNMTAVYGDDDDWPELALEARRSPKKGTSLYRLYDSVSSFWIEVNDQSAANVIKSETHDVGYCPVVRFVSEIDDDGYIEGEVEPLIPLQDQINITTFGLLVAQHYGAFRQRYIMGWVAPEEDAQAATFVASARKLWTFEDPDVKVGEFNQTDLKGYIDSREATLRHLATVSQTPAHELLGQLVNLSAEALAAAEASHRRKVLERETTFGESWEQTLELAAKIANQPSDPMSSVRWRDTEARALSNVADALVKLMSLGVPPQELWERIPGVTQQDLARWKEAAENGDVIGQLNMILERQSKPGNATPPAVMAPAMQGA